MNAGQYLVSKSPLTGATAIEHFLAMQTSGGTVFAHRFSVRVAEQRLTLSQVPSIEAVTVRGPVVKLSGDDGSVFVMTQDGTASVMTRAEALTVSTREDRAMSVRDLDDDVFTLFNETAFITVRD